MNRTSSGASEQCLRKSFSPDQPCRARTTPPMARGVRLAAEEGVMRAPRTWMWIALIVQVVGMAYDFVWHGLMNPSFEAATVGQMVQHLSTVHLPLYIGVLGMLLSSAWALIEQRTRHETGLAIPVAFFGALVQTAGETWHAYSHLQLSTHIGPIAFTVSFAGMIIVAAALWLDRRHRRGGITTTEQRRAGGSLTRT